jgi:hypothetical protein
MINFDTNCYHSVLEQDHDRTEWREAILAWVPPANTTNFWHLPLTVTFTKKKEDAFHLNFGIRDTTHEAEPGSVSYHHFYQ